MTLASARAYNSPRLIARHAAILAATRAELADRGFHGVTMNRLAERAGVTKKTLYNIYQSKDALLAAAISDVIGTYREVPGASEPGAAAIVASRRAAIEQVRSAPDYAMAMMTALVQEEAGALLTELLLQDSVASLVQHLEAERQRGGLCPGTDAEALALQLTGQAWGQVLLLHRGLIDLDAYACGSVEGLLLLLKACAAGSLTAWIDNELIDVNTDKHERD